MYFTFMSFSLVIMLIFSQFYNNSCISRMKDITFSLTTNKKFPVFSQTLISSLSMYCYYY